MLVGKARLVPCFVVCALAVLAPRPAASFTTTQIKCANTIGKLGLGYVRGAMKIEQRCRNAVLTGGTCSGPDPAAMAKLEGALRTGLAKACTLP